MEVSVRWVDTSAVPPGGPAPVEILERPLLRGTDPSGGVFSSAQVARVGDHWVPQGPVLGDPDWAVTTDGEFLRVPLFTYRTSARALAALVASAMELALVAAARMQARSGRPPKRALLVLGHAVADLAPAGQDAYRYAAGFVFEP